MGQISAGNYIVQFTSGKFTGNASVTSQIINSSFTQTKTDVSTKYLAIDVLVNKPIGWACDGCIPGVRYIQYEIPAALGIGSDIINGSFSGTGTILDPALDIKGFLGVMSFGTQRDYVLGWSALSL